MYLSLQVPSYATAIEGGGAIILSPDMDEVLLMRDIRFPFFGRYVSDATITEKIHFLSHFPFDFFLQMWRSSSRGGNLLGDSKKRNS